MDMIRQIDTNLVRRTIVKHTLRMLDELNIVPLCEGVGTVGEMSALRDLGVSLIHGYLLAKPSFEQLAIPASAKAMLAAAACETVR
jgi:EAL domain-containing protein (putative c-di-GMP-specific phosphodiesterase class I)